MSETPCVFVCMRVFHYRCSEDCYLSQINKNALLLEVFIICHPELAEVAGNAFSDFQERRIGPGGINNTTSL